MLYKYISYSFNKDCLHIFNKNSTVLLIDIFNTINKLNKQNKINTSFTKDEINMLLNYKTLINKYKNLIIDTFKHNLINWYNYFTEINRFLNEFILAADTYNYFNIFNKLYEIDVFIINQKLIKII